MASRSDRFVVVSVTGYKIDPAAPTQKTNSSSPPKRSFSVLDSAFCYRIMGEFNTGTGSLTEKLNERRAQALCDELNAWDRAEGIVA